jgi:hypothetical protein
MTTLTFEDITPTDLELFISLAKRLKIKTKVSNENELIDYLHPQTGEPMRVKEFQKVVKEAETTGTSINKEEFLKQVDQWKKKLSA